MGIHIIDMTGDQPKERTVNLPKLPEWSMAKEIGYKPKTTFWDDFSIAELYGEPSPIEGIIDTAQRAFREWKHDVVYITELSLVLNHKGFFWHNVGVDHGEDEEHKLFLNIRDAYMELWRQLHDWVHDNLKGDDFEYYFQTHRLNA